MQRQREVEERQHEGSRRPRNGTSPGPTASSDLNSDGISGVNCMYLCSAANSSARRGLALYLRARYRRSCARLSRCSGSRSIESTYTPCHRHVCQMISCKDPQCCDESTMQNGERAEVRDS